MPRESCHEQVQECVSNLVPGRGARVGEAIVSHPDVDLFSFTGSAGVGSRIAALASTSLKRVCLELGGKSASVVLDDADLHAAVRATVDSATYNTGQTCSAWTRVLVPAQRYPEAVATATERAAELVVGDPTKEETDLGPLISAMQRQLVLEFLARARVGGATVTAAGHDADAAGHFLGPVIVSDVTPQDDIVTQEVFGPVLVELPYDTEADAVRLANDNEYGLSGAVWSGSDDRVHAVAVASVLARWTSTVQHSTSALRSAATRSPVTAASSVASGWRNSSRSSPCSCDVGARET